MKDYYYILGVPNSASHQAIKTAYYKLAKKFHPDNNDGDKFFEDRFKDIQEAYEYLSKNIDNENFKGNADNDKHSSVVEKKDNYIESIVVNSAVLTKFEMVFVKGGNFEFGETNSKAHMPLEKKIKYSAKVTSFFIAKYPVTQILWKAVMEYNRNTLLSLFSKKSPVYTFDPLDSPVQGISWEQAIKFIKQLNELTKKNYRLPSHEEWEFAALGGVKSNGFLYAGSNELDKVGWYSRNSAITAYGPSGKYYNYKKNSVGLKLPNELGIYDMSGSVFEYCADAPARNINHRIIKGGCYLHEHWCCEVQAVDSRHKDYGTSTDGLRLAISI